MSSGGGWFAAGKHPSAKDFFRVGEPSPLARRLYRWLEENYRAEAAGARRCWRFWAVSGSSISYGVLTDSSDSFGRPYPLLVMGEEREAGWGSAWEAAPSTLSARWGTMEKMAVGELDFVTLKRLCRNGEGPDPQCAERQAPIPTAVDTVGTLVDSALQRDPKLVEVRCSRKELREGEMVAAVHAAVKQRLQKPPSSVFIGGALERPRIIFFYRPLTPGDFSWLWRDGAGDGAT
jgi:type VI secretion system ImpM family protein